MRCNALMFCQRPTWPLPGMSKGEPLPNMEDSETHIYGPPPMTGPGAAGTMASQMVTLIWREMGKPGPLPPADSPLQ